jgi:hypothetical protein
MSDTNFSCLASRLSCFIVNRKEEMQPSVKTYVSKSVVGEEDIPCSSLFSHDENLPPKGSVCGGPRRGGKRKWKRRERKRKREREKEELNRSK